MDKRTLLAVVLSVVVISVGFMIQGILFPPPEPDSAPPVPSSTAQDSSGTPATGTAGTSGTGTSDSSATTQRQATTGSGVRVVAVENPDLQERTTQIETETMLVTFSTRGGEVTSVKLKDHTDDGEPIDMIFHGDEGWDAFFVTFGGINEPPVDVIFDQVARGPYSVEFRRDFLAPAAQGGVARPFTLIKTYTFEPTGYMFKLSITIENSVNEFPNLDFGGLAYTVGFGPQIGPEFDNLGGRGEYRYYYTYQDGKRKNNRLGRTGELVVDGRYDWAGIVGKYFTVLGVPMGGFQLAFASPVVDGLPTSSFMYFSRPVLRSSKNTDDFYFYLGPKRARNLAVYNDARDNAFELQNLNLDEAVDTSALLGWLETILKFFLDLFYRVIPNYGVAIILLTIFIKVLFFPITRKSFESTSKMQALNPKIQEIREKYKDDSTRMNQEMAALYKKEKVNPLGGCLPLLLQMPIFIALYGVLSKHFALRGAPFMLWITDLSEPDSILNFGNFVIPILNWNDLRILPLLFIGTQLASSKLMQTPSTSTSKNMKMMQTFMPVFFFFILYNAPSGLLLYWTMTNVLTAGQQYFISTYRKSHPGGGSDDHSGGGSTGKGGSGGSGGSGGGKGPQSSRGPGGGKRKKKR